ncbi:dihydropteroate synthase [Myroides odoratus]|jgi:dihydropteroate synthase|uniref:Dihydropteroate synthase n=1 Tax=Myroides odoratus TaxID=256 RepID=A0A9Q6ZBZ6_MYROD|nr:dihydropteroate synthase [Myroides odoratus]EHQ43524.1 dihydropteroate synthase [Myroides odoratus DSM 2801]EKB06191.1 dihydropteroate synthase [Myroides odoratus CIP 103059]QQU00855.1 dihydropteroate synthase [Myroides odoratus]WQD56902.1 dihydropteroate synthase [Myroides odoratus]STZ30803.1 Dihydropteroate synthase [Myroides odoratus]
MTINCKGELIDLSTPRIMGILNVTPNSFYDGGKYKTDVDFLNQVEKMLTDGADFIDLGAYSSKPSAEFVSEEEEIKRLVGVVTLLVNHFPGIKLSIDTFRAKVAQEAIEAGGAIVNDIAAGLLDDRMIEVVGELQVPYIMMHMRGNPKTMQSLTTYDDLVVDMRYYFSERLAHARAAKINDVILDPGFGFAKTREQNYELMAKLEHFHCFELPLLVGISRKSMLYKLLDCTPQEALNGTSVLNTIALQKGAQIIRVHDVKEANEVRKILNQLMI